MVILTIRDRGIIRERGFFILLILALLLLFPLGVSQTGAEGAGKGRSTSLERLKLATPTWQSMNTLPFELGVKDGYYHKEGIDLDILYIKSHMVTASLITGDVDYINSLGSAIRSIAIGDQPFKIVMVLADRLPHYLFARPSIRSVKELKGKVVGIGTRGSATEFSARTILKYHGLDPDKDLSMIAVGGTNLTYQALLAGSVDAAIIFGFAPVDARKRGFKELLAARDVPGFITPSLGIATTDKRIKEKPSQVKGMIRATLKALIFIKGHPKEVADFITREWKLDRELASAYYDSEVKNYTKGGKVSDDALQSEIRAGKEMGIMSVKTLIPSTRLADFTLLGEVQKELGLK